MATAIPLRLQPGTTLGGDFRIVRRLAAGAMGAVYIAEQQSTGLPRAIKIMNSRLHDDEKSRARFAQEARVGSQIDSPHVVEVVASGVVESSGAPWLAMELLEGEDLGALQRSRGAVDPSTVRELFRQLGLGLTAAHRVGLVHRDLKPENIFVAKPTAAAASEGAPFTVKLLDFGIAKVVRAVDATATAAGLGSPLWMAPEQVVDGGRVRTATDVWPVGLIAFLLLTGRHYWRRANDDSPMIELLFELKAGVNDAASVRAGEYGLQEKLPPGFDAWFARCTAARAEDRYADAEATFSAFEALFAPPAPTPASEVRSPLKMLSLGISLLVLLAALAALSVHAGR